MFRLVAVEIDKALKNRWFFIAVAIGVVLAEASAFRCMSAQLNAGLSMSADEWLGTGATGAYTAWLPVATGDFYVSGVFFLLCPLLCVVPYASSLRSEIIDGSLAQQYARANRWQVLVARYAAVCISAGLVVGIPLLVNFATLLCALPASVPEVASNIYIGFRSEEMLSWLYFSHPLVFVAVKTIWDMIIAGVWGGFVLGLSTLIDNRVVLLAGSFVIALVMDYASKWIFLLLDVNGFSLSVIEMLPSVRAGMVSALFPSLALVIVFAFISACLLARQGRRDLL